MNLNVEAKHNRWFSCSRFNGSMFWDHYGPALKWATCLSQSPVWFSFYFIFSSYDLIFACFHSLWLLTFKVYALNLVEFIWCLCGFCRCSCRFMSEMSSFLPILLIFYVIFIAFMQCFSHWMAFESLTTLKIIQIWHWNDLNTHFILSLTKNWRLLTSSHSQFFDIFIIFDFFFALFVAWTWTFFVFTFSILRNL